MVNIQEPAFYNFCLLHQLGSLLLRNIDLFCVVTAYPAYWFSEKKISLYYLITYKKTSYIAKHWKLKEIKTWFNLNFKDCSSLTNKMSRWKLLIKLWEMSFQLNRHSFIFMAWSKSRKQTGTKNRRKGQNTLSD